MRAHACVPPPGDDGADVGVDMPRVTARPKSFITVALGATVDRYCRHFLVASVFPDPDSPEMMMA